MAQNRNSLTRSGRKDGKKWILDASLSVRLSRRGKWNGVGAK